MKFSRLPLIFTVLIACILSASMALSRSTVYPTGTTIFSPEKAQSNVYIMVVAKTYVAIIDRNGYEYHRWALPKNVSNVRARLDKNGNLLVAGTTFNVATTPDAWAVNHPTTIAEYSWGGKTNWEYQAPDWHNEVRKLKNGNIIFPMYQAIPNEYLAKVKDVELHWGGTFRRVGVKIRGDVITEVNPKTGKVVWQWKTWEHIDINKCSPIDPSNDWTHMNSIIELPPNKWYDGGDKRFKPGNLLVNPRNLDSFYIIDRATGEIVWTGNHSFKTGLSHPHEPEMIEKGIPGEGNIIFFDNGLYPKTEARVGRSLVGELNPVNGELVWKYETKGRQPEAFFSRVMGSQERLPNGNTFISEDYEGRLFEVTYDPKHPNGGEVVWEYILPMPAEWSQRSRIYLDDYCPQMKAIKRATSPYAVTPPRNADFRVPGSLK